MFRSQWFRAAMRGVFLLATVAVAFLTIYLGVIRPNRLALAWGPLMTMTSAHGKLVGELNEPLRQKKALTSLMAVTAFKNHVSLLEAYKLPEGLPEEYAVGFRDYRTACKGLSDYLGDHAPDQAILDRCTEIALFMDIRLGSPPENIPQPILTKLQAVRDADGHLYALAQRDGLEPSGKK